jgi:hypothetical protein
MKSYRSLRFDLKLVFCCFTELGSLLTRPQLLMQCESSQCMLGTSNVPLLPYALSNQLFKVIYYYVIIVVAKSYRLEIVRQVNNRLEINPINDGLKLIFSDCLRVSVRFQELSISSHYYCLIT